MCYGSKILLLLVTGNGEPLWNIKSGYKIKVATLEPEVGRGVKAGTEEN